MSKYNKIIELNRERSVDSRLNAAGTNLSDQRKIPQYYVEGNHEAIIPPETWELVQEEVERRKRMGMRYSSTTSIFPSKIRCSECGNWYGSKVWHSKD